MGVWMVLWSAAMAGPPSYDVQISWLEPTCADRVMSEEAAQRAGQACRRSQLDAMSYEYREAKHTTGCEVTLHVWCVPPASVPGYEPAGSVVLPTLYADKNHRGLALALPEGTYPLRSIPMRGGGDWNNKASSARVPEGWTLRVCHEPNAGGRCSDLTADESDLGSAYIGNDQASWVVVQKGDMTSAIGCPRAFEHDNFRGKYLEVCSDQPDLRGSSWNDTLSSVLVPVGWTLQVCAGPNGTAPCKELTTDVPKLGDTVVGGDKASSLVIVQRP